MRMRLTPPVLTLQSIAYALIVLGLIAVRLADQYGVPSFGLEQPLKHFRDSFEQHHRFELATQVMDAAIRKWRVFWRWLRKRDGR